jgi:hypothetical protein
MSKLAGVSSKSPGLGVAPPPTILAQPQTSIHTFFLFSDHRLSLSLSLSLSGNPFVQSTLIMGLGVLILWLANFTEKSSMGGRENGAFDEEGERNQLKKKKKKKKKNK